MIESVHDYQRCASMSPGHWRPSDRLMLWIDAVGGYWLCLGDQITLGRPDSAGHGRRGDPGRPRRPARPRPPRRRGIHRGGLADVHVNERPVGRLGRLGDGSRIGLGESVRMLFRQPHPLSPTARLRVSQRPSDAAVIRWGPADGRRVRAGPGHSLSRGLPRVDAGSGALSARDGAFLPRRRPPGNRRAGPQRLGADCGRLAGRGRRVFVQPGGDRQRDWGLDPKSRPGNP